MVLMGAQQEGAQRARASLSCTGRQRAKEAGRQQGEKKKMTAHEIVGEINCSDLEGFWKIYMINEVGAVQRRRWPFNPVEVSWAERRQEKSAEFWVKFGFGFCILLLL